MVLKVNCLKSERFYCAKSKAIWFENTFWPKCNNKKRHVKTKQKHPGSVK